ncbi:UNVERIFIED_CONTAM: hypothetical protein K2H54_031493 [Gekko kuhli]
MLLPISSVGHVQLHPDRGVHSSIGGGGAGGWKSLKCALLGANDLNPCLPKDRFPAVNSLIQRINLRKRRDSLILGGVIGICTILLLLYAFH